VIRAVVGAVAVMVAPVVAATVVAAAVVGAMAGLAGAAVIVAAVMADRIVGAVAREGGGRRGAGQCNDRDRGSGGETSCCWKAHAISSRWSGQTRRGPVPPTMGLWSWALAGARIRG
jgi:hypothetical protein